MAPHGTRAPLAVALALAACSVVRSPYQEITVRSSEPDATVLLNEREAGTAPLTVRVRRDRELLVRLHKAGFEDSTHTVGVRWSTTGLLDAYGGLALFLPAFGLLAPGAHQLEDRFVTLSLFPLRASAPERTAADPQPPPLP
jgi:hypothetical protein